MASKSAARGDKKLKELERVAALASDEKVKEFLQLQRRLAKAEADNAMLKRQLRCSEKELHETLQRNAFVDELLARPIHDLDFSQYKNVAKGVSTPIIVVSDLHCEERILPETVNFRNEYTVDIARKRTELVFQGAANLLENLSKFGKYDTLVLAVLGDLISGYIHPELIELAQMSPTEACLFAGDLIHSGIQYLKKRKLAKRIIVVTANGNHSRTTDKRRVATAYANSFEWFLYTMMSRLYASDTAVKWKVGKGYHNWLQLHGRKIRFHHGDSIKYQGGVGGMTIPVNKAITAWNKETVADLDIFGHWHTWIRQEKWISNGSIIGYGPFTISIKGDYQEPMQTLAIVNRKHGCWFGEPIFCNDKVRAAA